jgi:serine kinase of HPr protein (carbohydrate metabolism regulator)
MAQDLVIRTSEKGWYAALARAYKDRSPVLVIDDAAVGFNTAEDSLVEIARKAKLGAAEITGTCIALGMSVVGVVLRRASNARPVQIAIVKFA